jgi:OOP family OmpA-OmpF porin
MKGGNMDRKKKFRSLLPFVIFVLFMAYATAQQANAAINAVDLNPKVASGQMVKKVNTLMVIFDATLSMNDIYKSSTKLNQEKDLIKLLEDTIPNLKLTAALRTFGELTFFQDAYSKALFWDMNYSKPALTQTIAPYTMGMGFSPLDEAFNSATTDLRSQPGRIAVIAFSDGEDMEKYAPVAAAEKMKSTYGDRICIYTVHLGENLQGRELMKKIADASQCGFMVTGDSISSAAGMADFVEQVFLEAKREEPVKQPAPPMAEIKKAPEAAMEEMKKAPAAATEVEQKLIEKGRAKLLVEFDFNKAVVKPKYYKEIENLTDVMKKYPALNIVVEGHTDNVGGKQYNEKLSQKRSEAIRETMVKKFNIDSTRIKAKGYGLSKPIASNATKEGRQQNRRVEAAVEYTINK